MSDESAAIVPVIEAFEALGIRYYIGGSVASSAHGVSRSTLDVDVIADLASEDVSPLVQCLEPDYYLDEPALSDAIHRRGSFNLIHLATMIKIDVFVAKSREMDRGAWSRIVAERLYKDLERKFMIASAEDVILNKLEWYRAGGEVSERQWLDVVGIMKVRADGLDDAYLDRWAS